MPFVKIAAKKALHEGVASRFMGLGFEPRDVTIVPIEPPLENGSLRGQPASGLNLGLNLNV